MLDINEITQNATTQMIAKKYAKAAIKAYGKMSQDDMWKVLQRVAERLEDRATTEELELVIEYKIRRKKLNPLICFSSKLFHQIAQESWQLNYIKEDEMYHPDFTRPQNVTEEDWETMSEFERQDYL